MRWAWKQYQETSDGNDTIESITLFENGVPVSTDFTYPYEFVWDSGTSGYYDLHFGVKDIQGLTYVNVSPVLRHEVFNSEPPSFSFQPVQPATVSTEGLISEDSGSFSKGPIPASNLKFSGLNYHTPPIVVFKDSNGSGAKGYAMINNGIVTGVEIFNGGSGYSDKSEILLLHGLDTSSNPIRIEMGTTFNVGIYCMDPDTLVNPEAFKVFINNTENTAIRVTGVDPLYYGISWTPTVIGRYSIRVEGATLDGIHSVTRPIEIEVFNDSENSIRVIGFDTVESGSPPPTFSLGTTLQVPFRSLPSLGRFQRSMRMITEWKWVSFLEVTRNLNYNAENDFYTLTWEPAYGGEHELLFKVEYSNGASIFSSSIKVDVSQRDNFEIFTTLEILPSQLDLTNNAVARGSKLLATAEFLGSEGQQLDMEEVDFILNNQLKETRNFETLQFSF